MCFIASCTCVVVSVLVICLLCVFLSMCLLCLTVLVNCLLNAFSICVGEVIVVSLTVIGLFWVVLIFVG